MKRDGTEGKGTKGMGREEKSCPPELTEKRRVARLSCPPELTEKRKRRDGNLRVVPP